MGWPKGKRRKVIPNYILNRPKREFNLSGFDLPPGWCRSYALAVQQEALQEFVESDEYLEAEPSLRDRAERAYESMVEHAKKYKEGSQRENKRRSMVTVERRQWIVENCRDHIFMRSRKQAIGLIQDTLRATGLPASSNSRLYADIAAIRKGWGKIYSQAKDK